MEEYEEKFASQVLSMFQSHEAAHFIKHWNDSYTNQVLGFVQDKSWVLLSLTFHSLLLTHTHTHTHTQVADALAGRMELRSESNWGALFDGKDLSNVKELRKTFDQIDEDKSGELDADEILTCLQSMGASEISKEDIENMMKIADTDGGGTVDFDEFVVMLRAIKDKADKRAAEKKWISVFSSLDFDNVDKKVLRRAFKDLDVDGGGTLDKDEVKPLISAVTKGDDATIDRLIKESDVDGNGLIDFEEFVSMVRTIGKGRRRRRRRR
ncbi:MAG: EF-hand domain-containing protein [SAR324 cluster bacterium]|nr:EF-hand domain-containing protein [SAR324 cluster bacterium]